MKYEKMITMMEVQSQLSQLLQETIHVTPVRLGRTQTPVVALVPWLHYLRWREALWREQTAELAEETWSISKASLLFLSYRQRLAPLLLAPNPNTVRAVVVNVWYRPIGAVLSWQDWGRFALNEPGEQLEASTSAEEVEHKRIFTIAAAQRHLLQFPAQFAQEEALGRAAPLLVTKQNKSTKQHDPVFAIVPWALFQQGMQEGDKPIMSNTKRCTPEQNSLFEQWSHIALGLNNLIQSEPEGKEHLTGKESAYMWGAELVLFSSREEALEKSQQEIDRCRAYPGQPTMLLAKAETLEQVIIPTMRRISWNDPRK